jgi:hypothetical protein
VEFFILILCAIAAAIIASHKGRSALGFLVIGLLLGPFSLLAVLFALILPAIEKCKYCHTVLTKGVAVCYRCRREQVVTHVPEQVPPDMQIPHPKI